MSESLFNFFREYPLWAVFIAVFMILPMIGAVLHIVLKALGRKGIDNSPPGLNLAALSGGESPAEEGERDSPEQLEDDDESRDPGHLRPDSDG
jgi:hypothetical protein